MIQSTKIQKEKKFIKAYFIGSRAGFTALLAVMIILSVGLIIGMSINTSGIMELQDSVSYFESSKSLSFADSCMEEGIFRLKNDLNYEGGNLTLDTLECSIQINDLGSNNYQITSTAVLDNKYFHTIVVTLSVESIGTANNIRIISWKEN